MPDHTALLQHSPPAVLGVPWALGDEPRVPVCSEPLGTGGVAEPKAADAVQRRNQLHCEPWAPWPSQPLSYDLRHPQATAFPAQSMDPGSRRILHGNLGRQYPTPGSTPQEQRHHERPGPCQGGARGPTPAVRDIGQHFACRSDPGQPGTGDYRTGPRRMGAQRGMDLAASGGCPTPGNSQVLLPSHPGRWESWGASPRHPFGGMPEATPVTSSHPRPGGPLPSLGRALTRSVGPWSPKHAAPPDHPTCVPD